MTRGPLPVRENNKIKEVHLHYYCACICSSVPDHVDGIRPCNPTKDFISVGANRLWMGNPQYGSGLWAPLFQYQFFFHSYSTLSECCLRQWLLRHGTNTFCGAKTQVLDICSIVEMFQQHHFSAFTKIFLILLPHTHTHFPRDTLCLPSQGRLNIT